MAAALALEGLLEKELVALMEERNNFDSFNRYVMADAGIGWCMANRDRFQLAIEPSPPRSSTAPEPADALDDIPF